MRMSWMGMCLLCVAAAMPSSRAIAGDAQTPAKLNALFIGNSFCDFYVVPKQVEAMCRHADRPAEMRRETENGFSLTKHWVAGRALERIRTELPWNVIVLQNASTNPVAERAYFDEYGRKFVEYIREHTTAEPVFYMTWARKLAPDDQATVTQAYCRLGVDMNVKVAPVGIAVDQWMKANPNVALLRDDRASHPNELGAYLAACVLYATITGQSPVGQISRIEGHNWLTQTNLLADVDPAMARRLQQHAWRVVSRFNPRDYLDTQAAAP
jgi:hypothetical protein